MLNFVELESDEINVREEIVREDNDCYFGTEGIIKLSKLSKIGCSVKAFNCSASYLAAFGSLNNKDENKDFKWFVCVEFPALLDDPSVLIEGVLFRARYLGSTQLVCEGQPTKSTRMCQAEEAVSRIKVCSFQLTTNHNNTRQTYYFQLDFSLFSNCAYTYISRIGNIIWICK